jgi:hypothetical protein
MYAASIALYSLLTYLLGVYFVWRWRFTVSFRKQDGLPSYLGAPDRALPSLEAIQRLWRFRPLAFLLQILILPVTPTVGQLSTTAS